MAEPLKLSLLVYTFSYGGNGGISSTHPDVMRWMVTNLPKIKADPRISRVVWRDIADTPITMTRNRACRQALDEGFDLLLMIDSDMCPDVELLLGDPKAKPFWESSFDFIYERWNTHQTVVAAPYCGPPPQENIYCFLWRNWETEDPQDHFTLQQFNREEAAQRTGIEEVAALPTGLILYDTRTLKLTEAVKREYDERQDHGWFYYEFDKDEAEKQSTEDVTMTRDLSLAGCEKLGYNPVHVNWDAWAGHWKPKCVRKPRIMRANEVGLKFKNACGRLKSNQSIHSVHTKIAAELKDIHEPNPELDYQPVDSDNFSSARKAVYMPDHDRRAIAFFLDQLVNAYKAGGWKGEPLDLVEVGSWCGETAVYISDYLTEKGVKHYLHCVDTFEGSNSDLTGAMAQAVNVEKAWEATVGKRRDKTIFKIKADSLDAAEKLGPQDAVLIDANHSYVAARADMKAWWKNVREGGVMLVHDYMTASFPGVTKAFDELFQIDGEFHHESQPYTSKPPATVAAAFRTPPVDTGMLEL